MTDDYQLDPDDAPEGTEKQLAGFPQPPLEECPIAFLGYFKAHVVFAMPEGEIREERASDIGRLLKNDIFNEVEGQRFLSYWRDAEDKFQRDAAAIWFIRHCRRAGYWDRSRPQRGLGVWPGGREHGGAILHRGRELWAYDAGGSEPTVTSIADALREPDAPIYAIKAARPAPAAPASTTDGRWLRHSLDAWHWEQIGDEGLTGADVVAGWAMAGLLGSVAPFRPHLLMNALLGSGKTTLINFVHAAQSALAGDVIDSFTRAGLANDLSGMARPVLIDEAETTPSQNGLGAIEESLDVIRKMATGQGSVKKMGTINGGSVTQTAVGAVFMGAVNPVKLEPADASRIAEVKLLSLDLAPRPGSAFRVTSDEAVKELIAKARDLAPAFLGRALAGSAQYLADVATLKAAFREQGHSPRSADLVAALAAGLRLLAYDDLLDAGEAATEAQFWAGLLESREAAEMVRNPGADCLAHLFNWPSGQHKRDRVVSLGEQVKKWIGRGPTEDVEDVEDNLASFGLKIRSLENAAGRYVPFLLVANNSPALERVFERTRWRDWRRTLAYLDQLGDAYRTMPGGKVRFNLSLYQRTTAVPLNPWLGRDDDATTS